MSGPKLRRFEAGCTGPDSAAKANNPDTHLQAYGLGWFLEDYRGRMVVHHGGNVDGFSALVGMVPEDRFGVVILTSQNGSGLPQAILHRVFDHQLGAPMKDWAGDGFKRLEAQRARGRENQRRQRPCYSAVAILVRMNLCESMVSPGGNNDGIVCFVLM